MPDFRLVMVFLPPMPRDALGSAEMPFLSRVAAEGSVLRFRPAPLDLTRQRLLAPLDEVCERLSGFQWRQETTSGGFPVARWIDWVPRRAFLRPLRRWIGRRWQRLPLLVDPAFTPAASLAYLRPVPIIDPEDNLLSDFEEMGLSCVCSVVDYPWLPQQECNLTWVDDAHERDYTAWARAAVSSATQVVYLELGHRLGRCISRMPVDSSRVRRTQRRLDRQLRRVLSYPPGPGRRQWLIISPEVPAPVRNRVDLSKSLETEHFRRGSHYVAVIHPTFVQVWSTDRQSRDYLEGCLSKLHGVTVTSPRALLSAAPEEDRQWGDWLALADPGSVFHPNHFNGRTSRRTATGWAEEPAAENYGFVILHGEEWVSPGDLPAIADVKLIRQILRDKVTYRL